MEIELKIKDRQNDKIILEDSDNNLIYWPNNKFPANLEVGSLIKFYIGQIDPKDILNELLDVSLNKQQEN